MEWMTWIGAALTLLGIAGLFACIAVVRRARREGLDDDAMRARLQKVIALNLGALAVSAIGLMMVVFGVVLA